MQRLGTLLALGGGWSPPEPNEAAFVPSAEDVLRITAIHDPPYLIITRQSDGSYEYSGYLHDLWEIIARELDLRYRTVPLLDGGYGSVDQNGTWSGLVGELAYGRADLALTWVHFRQDRASVVDYIDAVPVDQDQYTFYLAKGTAAAPQLSPAMFSSLLQPLHWHVWWTVAASLLVISAALRLAYRHDPCPRRRA
ncbi:glutamate receptor 3-like [Amphibalanus amphitrite]|uniref:glutamate receptor 3-like n=1 Tax=Amphibalanus amphitrite TaxID=1232801 RepID=UPI001C917F94|nr:glutamate receptor 3-like [Amphibalanus amphitrite]